MYCKNCGTKIEEGIKFCGSCGEKVINDTVNQPVKEEKNIQVNDKILYIISGINNPSMTFSGGNGHWLIIFTANSVFFVKTGWSSWYQGNPGIVFGAVGGLVGGLIKHAISKKEDKNNIPDLSSILNEAKKYYKFTVEQLGKIRVKKTWRNKTIFLDEIESSTLEIIVPTEQYDDFIAHIKTLYNYDFI